MEKRLEISEKTLRRFWRKVAVCIHGKSCRHCCWKWVGGRKVDSDYGFFNIPGVGKKVRAHRVMCILEKNDGYLIPHTTLITHSCDNPPCVNFHHLTIGSHQTNMDDKVERGRARGGNNLTTTEAQSIRHLYLEGHHTITEIAKLLGRSQLTISHILNQRTHPEINDGLQLYIQQMTHNRRVKI